MSFIGHQIAGYKASQLLCVATIQLAMQLYTTTLYLPLCYINTTVSISSYSYSYIYNSTIATCINSNGAHFLVCSYRYNSYSYSCLPTYVSNFNLSVLLVLIYLLKYSQYTQLARYFIQKPFCYLASYIATDFPVASQLSIQQQAYIATSSLL